MNHDTQILHGLGHFMTELIKYVTTTICFINEQHALKKAMSWNGYPGQTRNKLIKRLENRKNTKNTDTFEQENIATTFLKNTIIMQKYKEKHSLKIWSGNSKDIYKLFKLRNIYRTKIFSYCCNTKDKLTEYLISHIVHEFCCRVSVLLRSM